MSKVTKKQLQYQINGLAAEASIRHNSIMRIHRALASIGVDIFSDDFDLTAPEPQLKQLDQSIFKGLDEKWQFAAVDSDGTRCDYETKPTLGVDQWHCVRGGFRRLVSKYNASNWQNSLIERDIVEELAEVDLSSELTGSELCRAMLARGDKYVMCRTIGGVDVISGTYEDGCFVSLSGEYEAVAPINNQGEPLTAAEAGF